MILSHPALRKWRTMWPSRKLRPQRLLFAVIGISFGTLVLVSFNDVHQEAGQQELFDALDVKQQQQQKQKQAAEGTQDKHFSESANYPERPWYMKGGGRRPFPGDSESLWPHEDAGDRIEHQLMFVPKGYKRNISRLKKILLMDGLGGWSGLPIGRDVFLRDKCPVDTCEIMTSKDDAENADAILFKDRYTAPKHRRPWHQVWILYLLECPQNTPSFSDSGNVFNWTATYRHDSDIVAPYEKFARYDDLDPSVEANKPISTRNKTKKVAWFVSNCGARNQRLQFAQKLGTFIDVDIYGACGPHKCPRSKAGHCFDILDRDYKFYLAFENSNCKDYITEKFFLNGLGHDVLPIVMGARREDYKRSSPEHSFLHVEDFSSEKALADYLHFLDRNDSLYNEYFRWKGSGEFINTYFWCRLCAMLHAPPVPKVYPDIAAWWGGAGTCDNKGWREDVQKDETVKYVFT